MDRMADFTFCGGLYRTVSFVEVEPAHFDFSKCGTDGLFVTPYASGKTRFDIFTAGAEGCEVIVTIKDAEGNVVKEAKKNATEHTILAIDVREPHLWNGMKDPYCYTAEAVLVKDGVVVDEVATLFGYRSFRVDAENGFFLNGKACPLRGVSHYVWHIISMISISMNYVTVQVLQFGQRFHLLVDSDQEKMHMTIP